MTRSGRAEFARFAAPVAFLLAVTVAVLLVRAGLQGDEPSATTPSVSVGGTRASAPTTTKRRPKRRRAGARFYRVESGDTYGSIAAQVGTSVDRLRALNPNVDPNALQTGQRIRVK